MREGAHPLFVSQRLGGRGRLDVLEDGTNMLVHAAGDADGEGDVLGAFEAVQEDRVDDAAGAEADDGLDQPADLLGLLAEDEALNAIADSGDPELVTSVAVGSSTRVPQKRLIESLAASTSA